MKKALVVSHERSGTHFLCNTLELNFGYNAKIWDDLDEAVPNPFFWKDMFGALKGLIKLTDQNIIKTHFAAEFLAPALPAAVHLCHVFYIYRRDVNVMNSFSKHLNSVEWYAATKTKDGKELGLTEPHGAVMRYQYKQYPTFWDRWKAHVKGWMEDLPEDVRKQIIYVRYEDLNNNFNDTVQYIAKRLNKLCFAPVRPSKEIQVVSGGKFIV